jgi:hypothetical protein
MFDPASRYYGIATATHVVPGGRAVAYVRRRMLPRAADLPLLGESSVPQGERLDVFTSRTLGNPLHFWRICDANEAMDPLELVAVAGRRLRVPVPSR